MTYCEVCNRRASYKIATVDMYVDVCIGHAYVGHATMRKNCDGRIRIYRLDLAFPTEVTLEKLCEHIERQFSPN